MFSLFQCVDVCRVKLVGLIIAALLKEPERYGNQPKPEPKQGKSVSKLLPLVTSAKASFSPFYSLVKYR